MFSHIFNGNLFEENSHDFSKAEHSKNNVPVHILYHLKEDKLRYKRLFVGESASVFWEKFKALFKGEVVEQVHSGNWTTKKNVPMNSYAELYATCFVETVKWWFTDSCKESPERVGSYLSEFCG